MLYVFHGENELHREEALAEVIEASGLMPDLQDLNVETLTGPAPAGELRRTCATMPFLGDVRVVIARDVLAHAKDKGAQEIAAYLPNLPPTTHLVFVESKALPKRDPVLAQAQKLKADIRRFNVPGSRDLPGWISARAQKREGRIEPSAAALLARNIGPKLRILDQEIQKLLLYVGPDRPIASDDVRIMVPYVQSADVIFNLVDAIGQRNPRNAALYLHRLLDVGEAPLPIFGMIVRQFRLLIQVRWLMDRQLSEQEIVARLKLHPYVGKKVRTQAYRFTLEQLRTAYPILAQADLAIKTGRLSPEAALDLLLVELTSL
jgi:DNA polymerase-3 subunit delta